MLLKTHEWCWSYEKSFHIKTVTQSESDKLFLSFKISQKLKIKIKNTNCGDLIPHVHPCVLPFVCPRGIVPARPCVTFFTTTRTTFKAFEDILSGPLVPLSGPHLPDSLKSSLICKALANWHHIDWWDSSHPHVYFSRQARQVSGHQ